MATAATTAATSTTLRTFPMYRVDAFTGAGAYRGNPAAIVVLPAWLPDATLQALALENNLSETAFVVARTEPAASYDLRWFTPEEEVDLCGHATLASAHALLTHYHPGPALDFYTRQAGVLTVSRAAGPCAYDMHFPSRPPAPLASPADAALLLRALGLDAPGAPVPLYLGRARDILVHLPSPAHVLAIVPDFDLLLELKALCVIVCAAGAPGGAHDVVSRVFCPGCGVPEDPVTGSAHCTIAPYFGGLLNRRRLTCLQASQRGGLLEVELLAAGAGSDAPRVRLSGTCASFFSGSVAVAVPLAAASADGGSAAPAPAPALPPADECAAADATRALLHCLDAAVYAPCGAAAAAAAAAHLPLVLLTYAQSLDGALAAARGVHTVLSCPAALALTHRLRARHAGILVGLGTLLSDNPRLNTRLCAGASPVVCVLDPALRAPPAAHALAVGAGRAPPIVLHGGVGLVGGGEAEKAAFAARRSALSARGVRLLQLPLWVEDSGSGSASSGSGSGRHLDLGVALRALRAEPYCLESVMVEGGAGVHGSLVAQHAGSVARGGGGWSAQWW